MNKLTFNTDDEALRKFEAALNKQVGIVTTVKYNKYLEKDINAFSDAFSN